MTVVGTSGQRHRRSYVDEATQACLRLLEKLSEPAQSTSGCAKIKRLKSSQDTTKPNGTPRKLLDAAAFERGIREVYDWSKKNLDYAKR